MLYATCGYDALLGWLGKHVDDYQDRDLQFVRITLPHLQFNHVRGLGIGQVIKADIL